MPNAAVATLGQSRLPRADQTLRASATFWFITAVAGQWIFFYYIAALYGGAAARGDWAAFNTVMPHGFIAGDTVGNLAVITHVLLAAIVMLGGPLQLIPGIRSRFPTFHHWNGRMYLVTALVISTSGLFMIWTRGSVSGPVGAVSISLNAVLIMVCAAMTLRYAMARNIQVHRRWALRLFLVVSGVWFFRVGFMFWLVVNGGPVGFDPETFRGPLLDFLGFAQYLVPLAILEIYLRTRDGGGAPAKFALSGGLLAITLAMGLGIFAATMGMWLPRM